jgi:hypothetical protein
MAQEQTLPRTSPDTPPDERHSVRGRSPGSRIIACCLAFPTQKRVSDSGDSGLSAYSCGGSAGFAPVSLLASRYRYPEEP